jgi:hypothetical protein
MDSEVLPRKRRAGELAVARRRRETDGQERANQATALENKNRQGKAKIAPRWAWAWARPIATLFPCAAGSTRGAACEAHGDRDHLRPASYRISLCVFFFAFRFSFLSLFLSPRPSLSFSLGIGLKSFGGLLHEHGGFAAFGAAPAH